MFDSHENEWLITSLYKQKNIYREIEPVIDAKFLPLSAFKVYSQLVADDKSCY